MEVLSLIEHESIPILRSRERGQKAIQHTHANTLARIEKELPKKAWSWGNQQIKFGNYCGVISLGNLSIEILPKIYGVEIDLGSSRHALVKMLSKARRLKLRRAGMAGIALQKHNLLDIFILHFCDQLNAEMMQGMIRRYIERKENLNVLRGRLRFEQHIKQNMAHHERLFCEFHELSEDNDHNQILKYVLKLLLKMAIGPRVRLQVAALLMHFGPISDKTVKTNSLDSLSFDRSIARYQPIFEQCKWFLEGVYPDILSGKETFVSLLFDMNQLFEAYVGAELRIKARSEGLRMIEQGPQRHIARRMDTDGHVFRMKPDFSFMRGNDQVAIADAKWKLLDDEEKKLGISQADLYQMNSYATRYCVKQLFLIYPKQLKMKAPVQLFLKGSRAMVNIVPFDVTTKYCAELPRFSIG